MTTKATKTTAKSTRGKATAAPSKRANNTKPQTGATALPSTKRTRAGRAKAAAAKLAAPPAVEPVETSPDTAAIAAMPRLDRLAAAKAENAAIKAWRAAGEPEPRPATPVLDWMNATPVAARTTSKAKGERTSSRYTAEITETLKARIATDRAAGLGFPAIAAALNAEKFSTADWTGPKLYAFATRQGIGAKLSTLKGAVAV